MNLFCYALVIVPINEHCSITTQRYSYKFGDGYSESIFVTSLHSLLDLQQDTKSLRTHLVGFLFLLLLFLEELYGEVSLSQFSLKPFLVRRSTFQKNYPNIFKSNLQNFTGDVKLHLRKTKFPEVPFSRPSHDI